ncbi:hypothetical protein [Corynebacterium flavescens]|uniref:hypothetical protein n=1 Tax=Corynebacterium flavescens TaxID=28028 RepID=UPI00257F1978|nr:MULTISPECIES: hypothetical protein [Corynebacterium]
MTIPAPRLSPPTSPKNSSQNSSQNPSQGAPQGQEDQSKRTETVSLLIVVWLVALVAEFVHQCLSVIASLLNRDQLLAQAREQAADTLAGTGQDLSDSLIQSAAYGSIILSALFSFAIIAVLAWMLWSFNKPTKRAGTARRLWFFFSLYFGIRIVFVFLLTPAGSKVPDWLFVLDGSVQIIVGVAAVMGLFFSSREETLDYTGELEQMREMEKELQKARREREEEERQKSREEKLGELRKGSKRGKDGKDSNDGQEDKDSSGFRWPPRSKGGK